MPLRNLLILFFAGVIGLTCYEKAARNRYASIVANAMKVIDENYVDEVDPRDLFENAMNGMVGGLDEYSDYVSPKNYEAFQQSIEQEFVGIGVEVVGPPRTDRITVMSPVFDTPAYNAGIRAGDVIVKIDGASTEDMRLVDAIDRIKGPKGTTVSLTVLHRGETAPVTMQIRREVIRTESVLGDARGADGKWSFFLQDHPEIGYVRLRTFGEHTSGELRRVLAFKDYPVKALILDLRGNVGGLLRTAVETCDMFLDEGEIVSIRGRSLWENERFGATSETTIVDKSLPLVVLVDRYSASASEIVAACLTDHNRAVIVGQRTWGKGTVQNVLPLEGGRSALKLTTASYWRPSGKNIHRRKDATEDEDWGVRPSDGFEVIVDDEDYAKILQWRRVKDVLPGKAAAPGVLPSELDDVEPVADPQLRRAVDYLLEQLSGLKPPAARA